MSVLILLADNVYLTPYINFYISVLDKLNIVYKIIYWDKNDNEIINDSKYIRFSYNSWRKEGRALGYLKYRKIIRAELTNHNYTILIPLHSIISFILFDIFIAEFKYRYIYDVRDYSYEKFFVFRWIQQKLVNNSIINIVSSKGYKRFLPQGKYFVTHNIPKHDYDSYKQYENNECDIIYISYIGLIRFMEQNKKILLFFKNDKRFHLNFIGTNANKLKEFCDINKIYNVTLIDTFKPQETLEYYKNTDIVMNLYGNKTPLLDYALSNKLYYSACLYKPILVCEGTYMEKVSSKYGFGFTLKMDSSEERDELYHYFVEIDREKLARNCDAFMDDVLSDEYELEKELIKSLENLKEEGENR